jgi:hypothetical protein
MIDVGDNAEISDMPHVQFKPVMGRARPLISCLKLAKVTGKKPSKPVTYRIID